MHIAMVGSFGLHPNKTMESRALNLARQLVRRGHEVQLFMPPWQTPEEADRRWQIDGVGLRYIAVHGGPAAVATRLVREVSAWRPDVVHCFKPKAYSGLVGEWTWRFQRRHVRVIVDADDWEGWGGWNERGDYSFWQKRLFSRQEQWGYRHNHALTVASRALQTLAWAAGAPPERVLYLPNGSGIERELAGLEPERAGAVRAELGAGGRPILLIYSRLFEFALERLVAVLAAVVRAVPRVRIVYIGQSLYAPDAERFRRLLEGSGLLDAVLFKGWLGLEELPAYLAAADAGLYLLDDTLVNRAKCPVKLADMVAAGLPVVGEAVGQAAEYVLDGRSGYLHAPGMVDDLAADLTRLLVSTSERSRMAEAAKRLYAGQFTWELLAGRLEQVYLP
jgi:glycosyltransferase involved in cell wall biosynthesis